MPSRLFQIEWNAGRDRLIALEPFETDLITAAPLLAASYNDPHSREMMLLTHAMSPREVIDRYVRMAESGAHTFLLLHAGDVAGDAELRHIEHGHAEMAIQIARAMQGRGLGTKLGLMLHVFAFRVLDLDRVYATILPQNAASLRLFEKLGYRRDDSPEARSFIDEPSDVSLSLARADFERAYAPEGVRIIERAA